MNEAAGALRSLLQLTAPPIAIGFHDDVPVAPPRFAGRVPAGCVFWMQAVDGGFTTVAGDHACSVGSYTHGLLPLAEAATREDVAAIVEAGWVAEEDFAAIPAVSRAPAAITYEPLESARHGDVVLVRLPAAGLMTLLDAWPSLRIEGKPQCHIVALAQQGVVAASVGCALSRARTGMPVTEATAAFPMGMLDELLVRLRSVAEANVAVARYAGRSA